MVSQFEKEIGNLEMWALLPTIILAVLLVAVLVSVACQPTSSTKLTFSVSYSSKHRDFLVNKYKI